MRTIKQLLELMLERQDLFFFGLCGWAELLLINDLIKEVEYRLLRQYINENKPDKTSDWIYYFEPREITPRIEWINQQIEKL